MVCVIAACVCALRGSGKTKLCGALCLGPSWTLLYGTLLPYVSDQYAIYISCFLSKDF